MSAWQEGLKIVQVAVNGYDLIEQFTGFHNKTADEIVAGVKAVVEAVSGAKAGTMSPDDALAALQSLRDQLASNDAAADKALHEKFDVPPKG